MSEKQGLDGPPPSYEQAAVGYPAQPGYQPVPQDGYHPQAYPPPQQPGYPPQQPGYPPQQQGYPPQQQGYPPAGYPAGYPPAQTGYPHAQGQPHYGQSQSSTVVVTQQPYMPTTVRITTSPPDYMISAILACLCCFWPTGLCAIYYACRRNTLMSEGNDFEANRMAVNAKNLVIASVVLGIIWIGLAVILRVVAFTATTDRY